MLKYTTSMSAPFDNLNDISITTMIAYVIPRIGRLSSHIPEEMSIRLGPIIIGAW